MTITGAQIVAARTKYNGVPYSQRNPQSMSGMDCSGVIQAIMRDLGVTLSRTTITQLADASAGKVGKNIGTVLANAQPGDIIHYLGHEEMWLGGGKVFSEATYGTVAGDRGRTNMEIAGIVRYAEDGASSDPSAAAGSGGSSAPGLAILANKTFWIRVLMFAAGIVALALIAWDVI